MKHASNDTAVIDLFCGIGGLSHGFVNERFNVVAGVDTDESCKYAFETNNNAIFISKCVSKISKNEITELFGSAKVKILVGCAPCQPFSSYTFKDEEKKGNEKWKLLYEFTRIVKKTQPDVISMENVSQLLNFKKAPVFEDFLNALKESGYHVYYQIINSPDYGIPQKRKRLVLLASKFDEIQLIPKTHSKENYVTVKDAIGKLPAIKDGETEINDKLHFDRKLSPLNTKRIQKTPYGGSWKDWPNELKLKCHKKDSGKSYPSVYGRMKWEEPSPTMTTHCIGYGNGRFGHPEQNRAISLREAALLQTFPISYKFFDDNVLILSELEELDALNGFTFKELNSARKRKFSNTTLKLYIIDENTDEGIRADIFRRVNEGGKKLEPAEIRKGKFIDNQFYNFILEMSDSAEFNNLFRSTKSSDKLRGEKEELITRFLALSNSYQSFVHSVKGFLDEYIIETNKTFNSEKKEEMKNDLHKTLDFVQNNFPYGFRKSESSKSIPRVRFEALAVGTNLALREKQNLIPDSLDWINSNEFKNL